jgi:hypothetical protein
MSRERIERQDLSGGELGIWACGGGSVIAVLRQKLTGFFSIRI